jgi:hypothetical protein
VLLGYWKCRRARGGGESMRKLFDLVKNADRPQISIYIADIGEQFFFFFFPSPPLPPRNNIQYRLSIPSDPISAPSITRVNKALGLLRHAPNSTPEGQAKKGGIERCHCHRVPILGWTFRVSEDGSGPQKPNANMTQVRRVSRVSGKTKRFT